MTTITLVGMGVVGKAILNAHLSAGLGVRVLEADRAALENLDTSWLGESTETPPLVEFEQAPKQSLFAASVRPSKAVDWDGPPVLIESIAERLDLKQAFFAECEAWMPSHAILASNTSTLPIENVGGLMKDPSRLIGMHFFMPVQHRLGVEVIASRHTDRAVMDGCCDHAIRLGKEPFCVGDRPGFVVNRMLAPYINEAIGLLCRGATAEQIEAAALSFGMPLSPLELVDVIGTRTAFDGGRVYWQSYPGRMTPSPLLPALVKRGRLGKDTQRGFYDYRDGMRSECLADETQTLVDRYRRDVRSWTTETIEQRLAAVMWIESRCILRDGVVEHADTIDLAMRGGLGFGISPNSNQTPRSFLETQRLRRTDWIADLVSQDDAFLLPPWLAEELAIGYRI